MTASVRADQKRARTALGQLPLSFEINRGQFDPQVQFASRGAGYKTFLTQHEVVFVLKKPGVNSATQPNANSRNPAQAKQEREARAAQRAASKAVVRMTLVGANAASNVSGLDELPGKINYFRGNNEQKWITGVPTFRKVSYAAVYPGIDLVYYGKGSQLEYDLVVAPGADPSQIAFDFSGAEQLEVDAASGALVVHAAGGAQMRQGKPLIYQMVNGARRAVTGGFTANGNRAGFSVGDYDRSRPLVIDPTITYSTYLAGWQRRSVHHQIQSGRIATDLVNLPRWRVLARGARIRRGLRCRPRFRAKRLCHRVHFLGGFSHQKRDAATFGRCVLRIG
jgi:hypothetical protein